MSNAPSNHCVRPSMHHRKTMSSSKLLKLVDLLVYQPSHVTEPLLYHSEKVLEVDNSLQSNLDYGQIT